jgi:hypothetical protein
MGLVTAAFTTEYRLLQTLFGGLHQDRMAGRLFNHNISVGSKSKLHRYPSLDVSNARHLWVHRFLGDHPDDLRILAGCICGEDKKQDGGLHGC